MCKTAYLSANVTNRNFFLKNPLTFSAECSRINKSVGNDGSQKDKRKPNNIGRMGA